MRPLWKLALAALVAVLALTACGRDKRAEPEPSPTATPTPTVETPEPVSPTPAFVAPLTGLPVEQPPSFRPFTVMINNYAAARPQSGLTYADIVWEVLAEGGITRLMAVFHSREFSDPIGPIRSIRPYLIDLGEMYGGVLVHAGASNDALKILQHSGKADLDEIYNAGAFFYRDKSRKAPHNLYSTLEMLREGVKKRKFPEQVPVPSLPFSAETPPGAASAVNIEARFTLKSYVVSYAYDASTGLYTRSINGEVQTDLNNNEPLTASNLVFLQASHRIYDKEGRLEIDLYSGGEALLFRGGKVISAEWTREKGDIIRIRKDGEELPFAPGVTYYHIIPGPLAEHVTFS
ncbi:MAG TPA: DUF3048 domain-containing protein [Paenibacillaceae bacterium]